MIGSLFLLISWATFALLSWVKYRKEARTLALGSIGGTGALTLLALLLIRSSALFALLDGALLGSVAYFIWQDLQEESKRQAHASDEERVGRNRVRSVIRLTRDTTDTIDREKNRRLKAVGFNVTERLRSQVVAARDFLLAQEPTDEVAVFSERETDRMLSVLRETLYSVTAQVEKVRMPWSVCYAPASLGDDLQNLTQDLMRTTADLERHVRARAQQRERSDPSLLAQTRHFVRDALPWS